MSKTVFKLWSILWIMSTGRSFAGSKPRTLGSSAHQISPLSITNQPFPEHQAGISEGLHQALKEFPHKHRPYREPQHSSDHEANQAASRFYFRHGYLIQHFSYLKNILSKVFCQINITGVSAVCKSRAILCVSTFGS